MRLVLPILAEFLLVSTCVSYKMMCEESKLNDKSLWDKNYVIAIDSMTIEYRSNVIKQLRDCGRLTRGAKTDTNQVFPWHRITFSGDMIDNHNGMISRLDDVQLENSIRTFRNSPVLNIFNYLNDTARVTRTCTMSFTHEMRKPHSSNSVLTTLPYQVYADVIRHAESCVENYACRIVHSVKSTKPITTQISTINALVDAITGNVEKLLKANSTIPAVLKTNGIEATSMTFTEDTKIHRVKELTIKGIDNKIIVRGFYNLSATFTINNFSMAAGTAKTDHLPVFAKNLSIGFEGSGTFINQTCKFSLDKFDYFNVAEGLYVDLTVINKQSSDWGLLGGFLSFGVNVLSNLNDDFRFKLYHEVILAIQDAIKEFFENINWEETAVSFIAEYRTIFLEIADLVNKEMSQAKAIS